MAQKTEEKELRCFPIEVRAKDSANTIQGYAALFNSYSERMMFFREKILPGAFSEAIKVSDVRALYNHDSNQLPLGRTPKTLRLKEDDKGLLVEIDVPDTQLGRDLLTSIKRGDISQMSFGFSLDDDGDDWHDEGKETIRTIKKVERLYDVSPVVYPAYPETSIALKRSLDRYKRITQYQRRLEINQKRIITER